MRFLVRKETKNRIKALEEAEVLLFLALNLSARL